LVDNEETNASEITITLSYETDVAYEDARKPLLQYTINLVFGTPS